MLETVRLGKKAKSQLITLKRKTGIENWNILCRWAFVLSIIEPSRPRQVADTLDGGIEMTWRTFGGDHADIYEAVLKSRLLSDQKELSPSELTQHLRRHIHRGIGYLARSNRIGNVADLASLALSDSVTVDPGT